MAATENPIVKDFWRYFNDSGKLIEIECDPSLTGGLATDILKYYGIPYKSGYSGDLAALDIKRMDAITVIRLSLLEQSAEDGKIYEPIVNDFGEVEFVEIGSFDGNISDRYYTLQTMQYREDCDGVMITGAKPRITRKPVEFKPIWGDDSPDIYNTSNMQSNCMKHKFTQYATIVFNDPHLDTSFVDGIDNLYELNENNPYDSIIGYVYYKDLPKSLITDDTVINLVKSCEIPIEIGGGFDGGGFVGYGPDVGTLVAPPTVDASTFDDESCRLGQGLYADYSKGVKVEIPAALRFEALRKTRIDKFTGIRGVYVIGYTIDYLKSGPRDGKTALTDPPGDEHTQIYITVNTPYKTITRLKEGRDYAVAYEEADDGYKIPWIVFANNARPNDTAEYGKDTSFKINPNCEDFYEAYGASEGVGTILPIDYTTGILVHQIFTIASIETPAIEIYDPDGSYDPAGGDSGSGRALEIAENMTFYVGALMIEDKPAPVGFNGNTINMSESIKDNDPTTAQDFEHTAYELALDEMQGGGFSINLSFLDGNGDYDKSQQQVNKLSEALYNYMNGTGTKETVYVCGPNCVPRLGGQTTDGIINEITYSYSDSSSYTISVNVGPRLVGDLAQVDGGPYTKMSDNVTAQGTIVQDLGSHVHFKVQIDGIGERLAVNMCSDILRVGDKVNCTVYNCPVEA